MDKYTVTTIYVSNWTRYQKYNGRGKGRVATLGSGLGQVGDRHRQPMQGFLWQKLYKKVQGVLSRNSTWFNAASVASSWIECWKCDVCGSARQSSRGCGMWCGNVVMQENHKKNNEYCQILQPSIWLFMAPLWGRYKSSKFLKSWLNPCSRLPWVT